MCSFTVEEVGLSEILLSAVHLADPTLTLTGAGDLTFGTMSKQGKIAFRLNLQITSESK